MSSNLKPEIKKVAAAIAAARHRYKSEDVALAALWFAASEMAQQFRRDDETFDRDRFMRACEE
jgi:hypothetical protein